MWSGGGKLMMSQLYTKNYRQTGNTGSGRHRLLQGRAHQLATQYHVVSPETYLQVSRVLIIQSNEMGGI